ncbi:hypothetical protein T4D_6261 [Trichinella pseudospiralis]|uniref:Uncharacterized protein n=1 Tax=Trichinella pseudospiralis TaxID=6337 RepID=A0A0V1FBZ1_TRIPS|nr:hypothetical protein T4D_6261 [Trichinella pseudospiralis]
MDNKKWLLLKTGSSIENMFSDWVKTFQFSDTEVKQLSFRMVGGRGGGYTVVGYGGGRVYDAQMTIMMVGSVGERVFVAKMTLDQDVWI